MLPGLELMACADLAVPAEVMHHVVKVESSFNQFAIGVVGGHLARQPRSLGEALSTTRMLEREGYNFSLGIAQVNRHNLAKQGLSSYEKAFEVCPNLQAGSRILAECYGRSGRDWGKAFSCYYSGNFTTGFRHGYVQKVVASWQGAAAGVAQATTIPVIRSRGSAPRAPRAPAAAPPANSLVSRRIEEAALSDRRDSQPSAQAAPQGAPVFVPPASAPLQSNTNAAMAAPSLDVGGPVAVQAMGAVPLRAPGPPNPGPATRSTPTVATPPPASERDAAFVF